MKRPIDQEVSQASRLYGHRTGSQFNTRSHDRWAVFLAITTSFPRRRWSISSSSGHQSFPRKSLGLMSRRSRLPSWPHKNKMSVRSHVRKPSTNPARTPGAVDVSLNVTASSARFVHSRSPRWRPRSSAPRSWCLPWCHHPRRTRGTLRPPERPLTDVLERADGRSASARRALRSRQRLPPPRRSRRSRRRSASRRP